MVQRAQVPTITNQPASRVIWTGANVTFNVGITNAGEFAYQWLLNGQTLPPGPFIKIIAGGAVEDGDPATNAILQASSAIVDAAGNFFIADEGDGRIRKVDTNSIITTLCGAGRAGYSGDGGPAVNAILNGPCDVALDPWGNLYVADEGNNCVRMINTNGIITTVAGNGSLHYSGDGGPALSAGIHIPASVAVDAAGNLYITDFDDFRIRKVDRNGIITTVAGNGPGFPESATFSGDGGPATNAGLAWPGDTKVDANGNLFIADSANNRIRKVDTNGIITTVAGSGPGFPAYGTFSGDGGAATNAGLWYPTGVAVDDAGNLFIADNYNRRIRKVDTNGIITTVAGNSLNANTGDGGLATNAPIIANSVFVDHAGNLFLVGGVIRKVDTNGIITTVAGNTFAGQYYEAGGGGQATNATIHQPMSVALDAAGNCFFADYDSGLIHKVDTNGILSTLAGNGASGYSGDGGAAVNAVLNTPTGLAADAAGNVYIADTYNGRIRKIGTNGIISSVAGDGSPGFNGRGSPFGDGGPATNAALWHPLNVAVDAAGNLYIADSGNQLIRKVDTNGIITSIAGNGYADMFGFGAYTGDGGLATNASLSNPEGMVVDPAGNLFFADEKNNRVRKVDTNGIITTFAGSGPISTDYLQKGGFSGDGGAATNALLRNPAGLALDKTGSLLIADSGNACVRKVGPDGIITTVAGGFTAGDFPVNDFPVKYASFGQPYGLAVDALGNLYIADRSTSVIQKVVSDEGAALTFTNVPVSFAGSYAVVVTGPGGSVTSSVANLVVATAPLIYQTVHHADGSVILGFVGQPQTFNRVYFTTNLLPPVVWQFLGGEVASPDGTMSLTDTNAINYPIKFYRSAMEH
jgi:sugar lactone lactonase YvrE